MRRLVAVVASVAVTAGLGLVATGQGPAAAAPASSSSKPVDVVSRPDSVSAQVTAAAEGHAVVDESQSSAYTTVSANPDGSWTEATAPVPVQAKDAAGAWKPIDTSLSRLASGGLAPANVSDDVVFSSGGNTTAASMSVAGKKVSWLWPSTLPAPTVSGSTATYQVGSTEQLVLTATSTGFSEDVVLTAPPAASADDVITLPIQTGTANLTTTSNSGSTTGAGTTATPRATGLVLKTAQGKKALWTAPPLALDATAEAAATTGSDAAADTTAATTAGATGAHVSPLAVSVAPGKGSGASKHTDLTLTPDRAWLTAPTTTYPVTIDPIFSSTDDGDAWVDDADPTLNRNGTTYLHVGDDAGAYVARTFLSFTRSAITNLSYGTVTSAKLTLDNYLSNSCSAGQINVARVTSAWSASTVTWNNQPSVASTTASFSPAYGASGCPAALATWYVTPIVQGWADGTMANDGLRLAAQTETYAGSFRSYWSREYGTPYGTGDIADVPQLTVTYDRAPATPTAPKVTTVTSFTPAGSTTSSLYSASATPKVSATLADPDGGNVKATFSFYTSKTGSAVASCTTGSVASGAVASCTLPSGSALANGTYYVRAVASDGHLSSASASAWTTITVAAGAPATPTLTCTGQANGTWSTTVPGGSVPCTITVAGNGLTSPGKAIYTVDGVTTTTTFTQPTSGNPATIHVTVPATAGGHSVSVTAVSPAGTGSAAGVIGFGYGTLGLTTPSTPDSGASTTDVGSGGGSGTSVTTTSGTVNIAAYGPAQGSGTPSAYVEWRLAGSGQDANTGWTKGPALTAAADAANGGLSFTGVWDTTTATTATNADGTTTPVDARTPQLLEVQVCADYTAGTECTWGSAAGDAATGAAATDVLRVAHAFGDDFPTTEVPGGQVALWTGEWQSSATDATLAAGHTSLSIERTASSYAGPSLDPAGNVFGPGWTTDLTGADAGYAGWQVLDQSLTEGVITLDDGSGDTMVFAPSDDGTANGEPVPSRRTGANLTTGTWLPVDDATAEAGLVASITGSGASTKLTLTDPDGTTTTFTALTAPTASTAGVLHPAGVTQPGEATATSYTYASGRVTRILAPAPEGITCPGTEGDDVLPAGCRAILVHYATATTATASTPGDYANQVTSIDELVGTGTTGAAGADAAATHTTTVATYAYDTAGRLVTVTDPRDHLATAYTYETGINADNPVITSITPPGLTPIHYTYDTAGKLTQVTRLRDSSDSPSGTADLATIAYQLPAADIADSSTPAPGATLSGTGLPDLSTAAVAAWGQPAAPTTAAAVFGPDHPLGLNGNGDLDISGLSANDWTYATLSYTDPEGRKLNDATYGAGRWLLTDTEYDASGNTIRSLSNSDIAAIQDGTLQAQDAGDLTVYNAEIDGTPDPSDPSGTPTVLLPADTETTDTYQTARWAQLADGTTAWIRPHTHTVYDQGAPNGDLNPSTSQNYALATTLTKGAADPDTVVASPGATEPADVQVDSITQTGYDHAVPVGDGHGETDDTDAGWDQALASSTTTVMDDSVAGGTAGAAPITTTTLYDASGDVIATNQPTTVAAETNAGSGPDAGTRQTIYYTAGATSAVGSSSDASNSTPDVAACDNQPGLDGLVCQTRFAGNPATGTALITTTSHYNDLDDITSTVETSGSTTRTTTTTYDAAKRKASTATSVTGLTGSTPVPDTTYGYDTATGLATTTTPASGAGGPITTGYDTWGRTKTYTTSTGTTTTSYDAAGNTATLTTPDGVITTNTYDGGTGGTGGSGTDAAGHVERRGLVTSITATATSGPNSGATVTETGAYDPAGNLTQADLPGGLSITQEYDTAGQVTDRVYSGDVTTDNGDGTSTTTPSTAWIGWSQTYDPEGRVLDSWTPDGAALSGDTTGAAATGYADAYTYDPADRLTQVIDQTQPPGSGGLNADGTDPDTGSTATEASCVIRQHGFDVDGNRTTKTTIPTEANGTCQSTTSVSSDTGVTTVTTGYDSHHSDQVTTTGYAYDTLGRITTTPQADTPEGAAYANSIAAGGTGTAPGDLTLGYYDTDTVHTLTQAGQTTTYNLDAGGRVLTQATGPSGGTVTSTTTNGYTDTSDSPSWETTTTGTASSAESYVTGLEDDLAATLTTVSGTATAQIAVNDPHGDTVAQITIPASGNATGLDDWSTTDEYGNRINNPRSAGTTATDSGGTTATNGTGGLGYGWLGGKTRATLATGLVLMGARLYNPVTGTFTSPDPVYGGNTTPYAYPQDPINAYDLNGLHWWGRAWRSMMHGADVAYRHEQYSVTFCVGLCGSLSVQGGHWAVAGGGVGFGGFGVAGGYASTPMRNQGRNSAQFCAAAPWGGCASMGRRARGRRTYWSVSGSLGAGMFGGPMFSKSLHRFW